MFTTCMDLFTLSAPYLQRTRLLLRAVLLYVQGLRNARALINLIFLYSDKNDRTGCTFADVHDVSLFCGGTFSPDMVSRCS